MSKKNLTYESAMKELQLIVNDLQQEMVNMDDLTEKVKRAKELLDFCKVKLRAAEEDVNELFD